MKVLVLDNYDSFTYNLVHLVEKVTGDRPVVVKNDLVDFKSANAFDHIILSPGPGLPKDAGKLMDFIQAFHSTKKILGVCLGHQAIAQHFGAKLINLDTVFHGVSHSITILKADNLFAGFDQETKVGRYHSWVVDKSSLPSEIGITARDEFGNIMAMEHKILPIQSVQFHPESILTLEGEKMMDNWFKL